MEFRPTPADLPVEIEIDDFCALVRRGQVPPTALYRTKWTKGEWRTVDNFRPFHKHSPVPYPPGEHLRVLLDGERRAAEALSTRDAYIAGYISGTLIAEAYGLAPLADLTATGVGAARLFILASFQPESMVTLVFHADGLRVEVVHGQTPLWYALPHLGTHLTPDGHLEEYTPAPFDPTQAVRTSALLEYAVVPEEFRSWEQFAALARAAVSCRTTEMCDGTSYRHQVYHQGQLLDVEWSNPVPDDHPLQCRLIDAYSRLLEQAAL